MLNEFLLLHIYFYLGVTLTYHGTCLHDTSLSPFDPAVVGKDAAVPVIRNPIDRINVTAGELLRFKVPEVTAKIIWPFTTLAPGMFTCWSCPCKLKIENCLALIQFSH
jgi:hypothetical protein